MLNEDTLGNSPGGQDRDTVHSHGRHQTLWRAFLLIGAVSSLRRAGRDAHGQSIHQGTGRRGVGADLAHWHLAVVGSEHIGGRARQRYAQRWDAWARAHPGWDLAPISHHPL